MVKAKSKPAAKVVKGAAKSAASKTAKGKPAAKPVAKPAAKARAVVSVKKPSKPLAKQVVKPAAKGKVVKPASKTAKAIAVKAKPVRKVKPAGKPVAKVTRPISKKPTTTKASAKPVAKPVAKTVAKPVSKAKSTKPVAKAAVKSVTKQTVKPAAKVVAKTAPAKAKVVAKVAAKAAPKATPKAVATIAKSIPKVVAKAAAKPPVKATTKPTQPKVRASVIPATPVVKTLIKKIPIEKQAKRDAVVASPAPVAVAAKTSTKAVSAKSAAAAATAAAATPAVAAPPPIKTGKPGRPPKNAVAAAPVAVEADAAGADAVAAAPVAIAINPLTGKPKTRKQLLLEKKQQALLEALAPFKTVDAETRRLRLKTLITLGKDRGYLTYSEINDHLPDDLVDAEAIESIVAMINDMGIQVFDEAPAAEELIISETASAVADDDVAEEAEQAISQLDSEFGRTTDPVRMYMREMGTVELLTREGEIEIAKRIEDGLKHMVTAISACPMTISEILLLADKIEKGEAIVDDIVDGLAGLEPPAPAPAPVVADDAESDEEEAEEEEEDEEATAAISAELLAKLKAMSLEKFAVIRKNHAKLLVHIEKGEYKSEGYVKAQKKITEEMTDIRFAAKIVEQLCDSVRSEVERICCGCYATSGPLSKELRGLRTAVYCATTAVTDRTAAGDQEATIPQQRCAVSLTRNLHRTGARPG